jgi:hypothetical protein
VQLLRFTADCIYWTVISFHSLVFWCNRRYCFTAT